MAISFVIQVFLVSCRNETKKMSAKKVWFVNCNYLLFSCRMPCCPCHLRHHRLLPLHHCCLVVALPLPAAVTAIAIGVVGCDYPYWCCCHHQCHSSRRRLPCLCRSCPDVSVEADALAAPPLLPSFLTDPTAGRLRLCQVNLGKELQQ